MHLLVVFEVHSQDPAVSLHGKACLEIEPLVRVENAGRVKACSVLSDDPCIDRPAVPERGKQAFGIHDAEVVAIRQTYGGPVPLGEIDMGQQKRPRDKGYVERVVLALHPVRPYPVEIMLDGARVQDAPCMEGHPGPEHLQRLLDIHGL